MVHKCMVHTFCKLMINIKVMLSFKNIKNGLSFMKPRKIEKKLVNKEILALHKKNMDSSTSTSETSETVSLGFDTSFGSFGVRSCMQWFFDSVRNHGDNLHGEIKLQNKKS